MQREPEKMGLRCLQRFQNCCTPEPLLLSGIFLKKMPPLATLKRASEFWNRSKSVRSTAGRE
jgi:hypothetical protein